MSYELRRNDLLGPDDIPEYPRESTTYPTLGDAVTAARLIMEDSEQCGKPARGVGYFVREDARGARPVFVPADGGMVLRRGALVTLTAPLKGSTEEVALLGTLVRLPEVEYGSRNCSVMIHDVEYFEREVDAWAFASGTRREGEIELPVWRLEVVA